MKMTTLGLVLVKLSLISVAAFWRASASALKLVEYFPVAMVICAFPSLDNVHPTSHFGWLLLQTSRCRHGFTGLLGIWCSFLVQVDSLWHFSAHS